MRTIGLEGMRFQTFIGLHREEKILGNEIEVNLYITMKNEDFQTDHLKETLDYGVVFDQVKMILFEPVNLLETTCDRIIKVVAALAPQIVKVKVRVAKIHPPVAGRVKQVFVEEEWSRI